MELDQLSGVVIDQSIRVHRALGPGVLESVYQRILAYQLRKAGFVIETEVPIPVRWNGNVIDESFRADLIVEQSLLLELKSIEKTQPVHLKQLLTYLKISDLRLGLLINFGAVLLKDNLRRLVNKK